MLNLRLSEPQHWEALVSPALAGTAEGTCGWEDSEAMETEPTLSLVTPCKVQNSWSSQSGLSQPYLSEEIVRETKKKKSFFLTELYDVLGKRESPKSAVLFPLSNHFPSLPPLLTLKITLPKACCHRSHTKVHETSTDGQYDPHALPLPPGYISEMGICLSKHFSAKGRVLCPRKYFLPYTHSA